MATVTRNDARLEFRLSSELKEQIERAALVMNRSLTDFATSAMGEAARRVLAEHEGNAHVTLSNRDRDRFLSILDSSLAPNTALTLAATKHRQHMAG